MKKAKQKKAFDLQQVKLTKAAQKEVKGGLDPIGVEDIVDS